MAAKHRLGKGIAALLPDEDFDITTEKPQAEMYVHIDKITANPFQPRKDFNDEDLAELANSIREHGIIQPLIVEESGNDNYIIVAGERRIRAAKIAGLSEIPVIVRKYSEEKRFAVSLIENIQRSDLNPIEEAAAYKSLMDISGLSQDQAAARVGKNRSTVANSLRLLKLAPQMQDSIKKGELSAGHARAILSITSGKTQEILFNDIIKNKLSVREAEKLAASLEQKKEKETKAPGKTEGKTKAAELKDMEEKFLKKLGTKVKIQGDLNKGSIIIDYYSLDDLQRLYDIIQGE